MAKLSIEIGAQLFWNTVYVAYGEEVHRLKNRKYIINLHVPNTDALVNATKCLKYEQASVLNKVIQASNEKKVVDKHL